MSASKADRIPRQRFQLPRQGRYEIFSSRGRTYCFDDLDQPGIPTPTGMHEWIRGQDPRLWSPMSMDPSSDVALYLQPELYLLWKLKWG
jgi:hypothetical protein